MYEECIEVPVLVIHRWRHRESGKGERHETPAFLQLLAGNPRTVTLQHELVSTG